MIKVSVSDVIALFRALLTEVGAEFERFTINLSLSAIPERAQFVGREKELVKMHRLLHGHTARSIVVLHGLGGIGKTQLAITYAMKHKDKYTAIFWMNANDEESLKLSFRDVAHQILANHPESSMFTSVDLEGNLDAVTNAVKTWLSTSKNEHWLMIYDNYDNPKLSNNSDPAALDIRQFLPGCDHGSVIITTRSQQVTLGQRIRVQKLPDVQESLQILSNTSGRKAIMNGKRYETSMSKLDSTNEIDPAAVAVAKKLDGLPLALSTAGAYLEQLTMSFSEYLRLYEESWLRLQMTSPQLSSYEDRSLYTTWHLSLNQIELQNSLSAKLLKLWAYFDRQDVWFELLQHGRFAEEQAEEEEDEDDNDWLRKLTEDELSFNETVRVLCSYGLVDPDVSLHDQHGSRGYSMHSCVHSWTVFALNKEWDWGMARLALTCIASEIPSQDDEDWWVLQRRLLPHATRQEQAVNENRLMADGMEWALHQLGNLYQNQGKLDEAEKMYIRALEGKEKALGVDHASTLDTVNNLGSLYKNQGKLDEAEKMYIRALEGYEKALGVDHTSTLMTIGNLGLHCRDQGNLAEAQKMLIRVLQGFEKAFGWNHPLTLQTVKNLEAVYADQRKLIEANAEHGTAPSVTFHGSSSDASHDERLKTLQIAPADSDLRIIGSTETRV